MRSLLCFAVAAALTSPVVGQRPKITFLKPDGKPAAGVQLLASPPKTGMGGGGGDFGAESYGGGGMGEGYGAMMGMDDGMEMGMGMGSYSPPEVLTLLNGKPISGVMGWTGDDDGVAEIPEVITRKGKTPLVFTQSVMAQLEDGFSFIPAGFPVKSEMRLRKGGRLIVEAPPGIEPDEYRVLVCWQNGFAWPTAPTEFGKSDVQIAQSVNQKDWRFQPRVRVFRLSKFGDTVVVPPGEVRVTITPTVIGGIPIEEYTDPNELFYQLKVAGPSQIVLVSGNESREIKVGWGPFESIEVELAQNFDPVLPNWEGDQSTPCVLVPESMLKNHRQMDEYGMYGMMSAMGGEGMEGMYDESDEGYGGDMMMDSEYMEGSGMSGTAAPPRIDSSLKYGHFLNSNRQARSTVPFIARSKQISPNRVRFELVPPGRYCFGQDPPSDGIQFFQWKHEEKNRFVATKLTFDQNYQALPIGESKEDDLYSDLKSYSDEDYASEEFGGASAASASKPSESVKSREQRIILIREMRNEVESVIKRMQNYRTRLMESEKRLIEESTKSRS